MSRYKNKSALSTCDICGKPMYARGIGSHKRQIHNIKTNVVTIVRQKEINNLTIVSEKKEEIPKIKCTERDLKILLGRIIREVFSENRSNLLSVFNTNQTVSEMIDEFENHFNCKMKEAKQAYPQVKVMSTDMENYNYIQFAHMNYSIK